MDKFFKISFDYILAILLLVLFSPIILVLIILSSISTGKFGIFSQVRVGKNANLFNIYKIRSMSIHRDDFITQKNDSRITKFGYFIRRTKLDELPQIINVIKGDMSFVGPRPDVVGYADKLKGEDRVVLSVKPGITGLATVFYKNEEELLYLQEDKDKYNDEVIWPNKVRINKEYIEGWSFWDDIVIIYRTIFS